MIFDSHCHPQFPQYDKDRDEMIKRALDKGIFMICVGTDLETSKKGIELTKKYEGMRVTIGAHPNETGEFNMGNYENIISDDKVVAVGEVGLDYYRTPEPEKQKIQKERFIQFLDLATKYKKPVVIHCRDAQKGSEGLAHRDAIEILKGCKLSGVAHSFTGTREEAEAYINLGFYLGFNGIVTFTDQYNELIEEAPLDKILLETDAPYLAPVPYRGQRNEPAYVVEVAKKIAELKNISLDETITQTTKNAEKLFGIDSQ